MKKPTLLFCLATLFILGSFGTDINIDSTSDEKNCQTGISFCSCINKPQNKIVIRNDDVAEQEKFEESSYDISKRIPVEHGETPMHKIEKRLQQLKEEGNLEKKINHLAVVLTTGAMNPVHKCHIRMLELAKTTLEKNEWIVLGGFLSATHDDYVSSKGPNYIPGIHRKEMIARAVENHDFIALDNYEIDASYFIEYYEVAQKLYYTLEEKYPEIPIKVFYVMGGDRWFFAHSIAELEGDFGAIVVKRNNDEVNTDPGRLGKGRHFVINDPETTAKDMSSTEVREKVQKGEDISDLVPQEVADYLKNNDVLPREKRFSLFKF